VGALALTAGAAAAASSAWDVDSRSAVRLVTARSVVETGVKFLRAGLEIKLQPGWKTYWRYPGDSGVPPSFDIGGSENVKSMTVLWPAPERFSDGVGYSIGYRNGVLLPLRVVPRDERKPVILRLKLDYAVCDTLCVPAKANVELQLTDGDATYESIVAAAEARVPKPAAVGSGQSLVIRSINRLLGMFGNRLLVDVASVTPNRVDLFAEGPERWALPLPKPLSAPESGLRRFDVEIDGVPPNAKIDGAMLRFTAVGGNQAIEVEYRLE
jgi:DsbC/DsbD-like thiol-disulfide interchange protein